MIDASALKEHYDQEGFVLIEALFGTSEIQKLQQASDALIKESRSYRKSDERFDLEPDHTETTPRVQRIKVPHQQHQAFADLVRAPKLLEILRILIGEDVRFRNSKLNIVVKAFDGINIFFRNIHSFQRLERGRGLSFLELFTERFANFRHLQLQVLHCLGQVGYFL